MSPSVWKLFGFRTGLLVAPVGLIAIACSSAATDELDATAASPIQEPEAVAAVESNAADAFPFDEKYTAPFEDLTPEGGRDIDPRQYRNSLGIDDIAPIYSPVAVAADEVDLFPGELVLGVEINGEARAYPHRLMQFREMANDVVGGVPILVSW